MKYFIIKYRAAPKGESGELCGSKYDLSDACKNCGTGAKLVGNLICRGLSQVKNDFFQTVDRDFLISERLYEFLLSKGIKLGNLKKVLDTKRRELPFYHLYTELIFPRFLPESEGVKVDKKRQCSVCKRDGHFSDVIVKPGETILIPYKLKYKGISKDFLESSDIFFTWECFGLSNLKPSEMRDIRYARPMLIVSERIKEAFEEFKVKKACFEDVIIMD